MTRRSRNARLAGRPPTGPASPTVRSGPRAAATRLPRRLRIAAFAAIAVLVGGVAVGLVASRLAGPAATDVTAVQVRADMGGFKPHELTVKAGQTVRVEFASLDTPYHSDGGGWHQLAIDELGIDWKVGPESSEVFEFTAPEEPGTYGWYCDICCGGKENPSMQGMLTVTA